MAEQQEQQPNNLCRHEGEYVPQQKNVDLVNTTDAKRITDICYDCLEPIFNFLDLGSLLNVAQTCKQLQIAAAVKFGHDFGKKIIYLNVCGRPAVKSGFIFELKTEEVFGLKSSLAVLRCFGGKISYLSVHYKNPEPQNDYLIRYINQYCVDSLTEIRFTSKKRTFLNESFPRPFKNVKQLTMQYSSLGNQLPIIANWFPNLRHLKLYAVSVDKTCVYFPHLEKFTIGVNDKRRDYFSYKNVVDFLHANRQLPMLNIHYPGDIKPRTIFNVNSGNSFISKFSLSWSDTNINMAEIIRFIDDHPTIVKLKLRNLTFKADDAIFLSRQLTSLKYFRFSLKNLVEFDHFLSQLASEWQHEMSYTNIKDKYIFLRVTIKR